MNAEPHGSAAGVPSLYSPIILLFWIQALLLTVATVVAVLAAADALRRQRQVEVARLPIAEAGEHPQPCGFSGRHLDGGRDELDGPSGLPDTRPGTGASRVVVTPGSAGSQYGGGPGRSLVI